MEMSVPLLILVSMFLTPLLVAQLTSTVLETLTPLIQAGIHSLLSSLLVPSTYPVPPSQLPPAHLALSLASHIVTGIILSPLDLVRTRLIIQSSHPSHRTYSGPLNALRTILHNEGGWRGVYTHPALLVPCILDNTIRPLLTLATPVLVYRLMGVEEDTHPMSYALASCVVASVSLGVTLPVETVRRRMQAQIHPASRRPVAYSPSEEEEDAAEKEGSGTGARGPSSLGLHSSSLPQIQACIELSPRPYVGILETAWRIITTERGVPRRRRSTPPPRPRSASTASASASAPGRRRSSAAARPAPELSPQQEEEDEFEPDEDAPFLARTGLPQLYRGLSMGLTANAVVFALAAFAGVVGGEGETGGRGGWTEL